MQLPGHGSVQLPGFIGGKTGPGTIGTPPPPPPLGGERLAGVIMLRTSSSLKMPLVVWEQVLTNGSVSPPDEFVEGGKGRRQSCHVHDNQRA